MKVWRAEYSWEFPEGGMTLLSPTLAEAKRRAIEHCVETMQEAKENAEKYGTEIYNHAHGDLSVEIAPNLVRRLDTRALCEIVNSNGCHWSSSSDDQPVMRVTMTAKMKKPKVTRIKL